MMTWQAFFDQHIAKWLYWHVNELTVY